MFEKIKHFVRAKKPEIMLGSGFVLMGGGIIWACNSSRKLDRVLDMAADRIEEAKSLDITDYEYHKAVRDAKLDCAWELVKMYGGPVALIGGGTKLIIGSNKEISTRLTETATLLAETTAIFGAYRGRVKSEIGVDADRHFMYGTKSEELYSPAYTDENGVEHPPVTNVYDETVDSSEVRGGIIFDERSMWFSRIDPQEDIRFLTNAEQDLRGRLILDHKLYMEDILIRLGLGKYVTAADKSHGFIYIPPEDPSAAYDAKAEEVFSLGIYNAHDRQLKMDGELGTSFLLYPTSHGCGPVYILDLHDKVMNRR